MPKSLLLLLLSLFICSQPSASLACDEPSCPPEPDSPEIGDKLPPLRKQKQMIFL